STFSAAPEGKAGAGGTARSRLSVTTAGSLEVTNSAIGGTAGSSTTGDGRAGSSASAISTGTATGAVKVTTFATGGGGGAAGGPGTRGGTGGDAEDVAAHGVSLSGGAVNVILSAAGGRGGDARNGARSGDGGSTYLLDAVSGLTTGDLVLSQSATGGAAGTAYPGTVSATGGVGGQAESVLTAYHGGSRLEASALAEGGAGAIFANLPTDRGGDARAVVDATGAGQTKATATAWGGRTYGNTLGTGSDAGATASASGTVDVQAIAQAYAGGNQSGTLRTGRADAASLAIARTAGGRAVARSDTYGVEGHARSTAIARDEGRYAVTSVVEGDVAAGAAPAGSRRFSAGAGVAVNFLGVGPSSGESAAAVIADPDRYVVGDALRGNANAGALLSSDDPLQKIVMFGAFWNDGEVNTPAAVTGRRTSAVIDFSANLLELGLGSQLTLAFLDPEVLGAGFDSLRFRLEREGTNLIDVSFYDVLDAVTYFDDQVMAFDTFAMPDDGTLDLRFLFDIEFTGRDDRFGTDFLVSANTVPLPASFWLLATAVGALATRRWSRPG
ncbi:MAG: VPLPA-CTERM sorting domain-containing protein, partial [Gammaproteobacteria bacterium]|nr:VPLPA-CTERM sorting domain-containing protein [Gammaproteobacteria bacterium]